MMYTEYSHEILDASLFSPQRPEGIWEPHSIICHVYRGQLTPKLTFSEYASDQSSPSFTWVKMRGALYVYIAWPAFNSVVFFFFFFVKHRRQCPNIGLRVKSPWSRALSSVFRQLLYSE